MWASKASPSSPHSPVSNAKFRAGALSEFKVTSNISKNHQKFYKTARNVNLVPSPRAFSTFQNDKPLFWKSSKRRPWGQNENLFSVLRSVAKSKMSASSLVKLSASAVIQDGCIVDGCDLSTLPRTVLQELLLTSISKSRVLCLRSLITNWPMQHLVLQNVSSFDEPKAVLLAYCLQRTKYDLKLVDMRGCNIGESNFEFL